MNLNQPKFFTPRKNQVSKDWQIWKEEFKVYLRLSNGYEKWSEEQRALLLLNLMGTEAHEAMSKITFENPSSDKKHMDILLTKFDEYFDPPLNVVEERFKFFSRRKSPNEDLDKYILDLNEKAAKCNFGNESEKFVIDMLILSMDDYLRNSIWAEDLKTLPEIQQRFIQHNIIQNKMKELSETTKRNLNSENLGNAKSHAHEQPQKSFIAKRVCSKCGENHPYKQCPAYDEICQKCFLKGHYTHKCKQLTGSAYKETNISKDVQNKAKAISANEESQPSTSRTKQNQEHRPKGNILQNCLWCDSYHIPGKCPHDQTCTSCNNFPHKICFNCKKNPHEPSCYYKNIITLPSELCTNCRYNHGNNPCKYCITCQAYGHWDNECPRKNRANNPVRHTINELADGFVEIRNALHPQGQPQAQAQPRRQIPVHQPRPVNLNQNRQNPRPQRNNRNNGEESDSCCIS